MQSLLIFIAEFQTAKRQLLNNFEVSGGGRSSLEPNEDDRGCDSLKAANLSENTPMYESRETSSHGVLSDTLRCNQNRIG
jgi:hypothetical protein